MILEFKTNQESTNGRPPTEQETYAAAQQFAAEKLSIIFLKLKAKVEAVIAEKHLNPEDVVFIFLDRDGRPSLHAWQAYTHHCYKSIPLPVSRIQFEGYQMEYQSYYYNYVNGSPFTHEELETEMNEKPIARYLQAREKKGDSAPRAWIDTLAALLTRSLTGKKHVFIIDTGYMGSMVYLARYILDTYVPNENNRTSEMLMLFGSNSVSAAPYLLEGSSHDHEHSIPHATTGYLLEPESRRMRYTRDEKRLTLEKAYIRGCVDYFKQEAHSQSFKNSDHE